MLTFTSRTHKDLPILTIRQCIRAQVQMIYTNSILKTTKQQTGFFFIHQSWILLLGIAITCCRERSDMHIALCLQRQAWLELLGKQAHSVATTELYQASTDLGSSDYLAAPPCAVVVSSTQVPACSSRGDIRFGCNWWGWRRMWDHRW